MPTSVPTKQRISYQGLNIKVDPFKLGDFVFPGGSVDTYPSGDAYLGVNLRSKKLHTLPRNLDDGTIWLAKLSSGLSAISDIEEFPLELPQCKIPFSVSRIKQAESLKVACMGSSHVESGITATYGWQNGLFNISQYNSGYFVGQATTGVSFANTWPTISGWSGGSPANYTLNAAGSGASGGTSITWRADSGGGRMFQDLFSVNGLFTVSVMAKIQSGSPTFQFKLGNKAAGSPIITTSMVALTSEYVLYTATVATNGAVTANKGLRAELVVVGGMAQLSDFAITGTTTTENVVNTNWGVGGSSPRLVLALLGRSVLMSGSHFNNSAVLAGSFPETSDKLITTVNGVSFNPVTGDSSILANDLFIFGMLANGGINEIDIMEGIVNQVRSAGKEVILTSDNRTGDEATFNLYANGVRVKELAVRFGCAFADTAAYNYEAELKGVNIRGDTLHLNQAGHLNQTECISGVLGHNLNLETSRYTSIKRIHGFRSQVPYRADVELNPYVASASPTRNTNNTNVVGVALTGEAKDWVCSDIRLHHPCCIGIDLAIDESSAFEADISDNGVGTVVGTISNVAGSTRVKIYNIKNLGSTGWTGHGAASKGLRILVTGGTMKVLAVIYHVPEFEDITDKIITRGTFTKRVGPQAIPIASYMMASSNTVGDYIRVPVEGMAVSIGLLRRTASGIVKAYKDGAQSGADIDLYNAVTGNQMLQQYAFDFNGPGKHMLQVELTGANGSAAAGEDPTTNLTSPTLNSNNRFAISQVFAIKDRTLVA